MKLNAKLRGFLQEVARGDIGPTIAVRAQKLLDAELAPAPRPAPAKREIPSVAHHAKQRRAEEVEREDVKAVTWVACCGRSRIDHRGMLACEACHRVATTTIGMEPHHLVLVSRTDLAPLVMVLCAGCHRLDTRSAHRAPRDFAQKIVIPWAKAHGFTLPNRREYREA